MNENTVKILCEINNDFYRENSESFSATRQAPWPGWIRSLDLLAPEFKEHETISILDLACGNLRFEQWLSSEADSMLPGSKLTFYAVDNCEDLLLSTLGGGFLGDNLKATTQKVNYQNLDIVAALLEQQDLASQLEAPLCDISVAFGFMHHIPSQPHRQTILETLIEKTKPGGYVIISFWQFLKNDALREKALLAHQRGQDKYTSLDLDENDFLLGWSDTTDQFRYCHSFFEHEIDELLDKISDRVVTTARYTSDGRGNDLNAYVVLKVASPVYRN